jgi:transglutaminase-like putative cysteine protease
MILAPTPQLSGQIVHISGGLAGVYQTLAAMRKLVNQYKIDPTIRQAATSAIFLTPEKDELSEVAALFSVVRDGCRYTRDINGVETLSTPDKTLIGKIGDCDDQTTLLAALLESVGYPTRFVIAGYHGQDYEHVYLQVWAGDQWINMDATEPYPMGWEAPAATIKAYETV